ncbi:FmdB family zinc ribbon protein [Arthrobacter sp. Br18]|uniref:FmdB family zinc ribbon protein n=1 Tax=Arthrobacter sp. Br18 TaxID=1312954 RepID=UPI00047BA4A0|nr:FmdB family zinc ribbon protein [Arthrobacter sp. Br18]
MPTYAYACKDCIHAFDIQQSFSDDSLTVCPECSGALRKKFNSVGVVFKGSGFYRNDSRDTKSSSDAGAASPTSGSIDAKEAGKPVAPASPAASSSTASGNGTPSASPAAAGRTGAKTPVSAGQKAS